MGDVKGLGIFHGAHVGTYTHRPGFGVLGSNVYSWGFGSDWGAPLRAVQIAFVVYLPNSGIGHSLVSTKATSGSGRLVPRSKCALGSPLVETGFDAQASLRLTV